MLVRLEQGENCVSSSTIAISGGFARLWRLGVYFNVDRAIGVDYQRHVDHQPQ